LFFFNFSFDGPAPTEVPTDSPIMRFEDVREYDFGKGKGSNWPSGVFEDVK